MNTGRDTNLNKIRKPKMAIKIFIFIFLNHCLLNMPRPGERKHEPALCSLLTLHYMIHEVPTYTFLLQLFSVILCKKCSASLSFHPTLSILVFSLFYLTQQSNRITEASHTLPHFIFSHLSHFLSSILTLQLYFPSFLLS